MHNQLNLHDLESNIENMKKSLINNFSNSYFCKDYRNLIENKKLVFVDDEEGVPIQNWGIHSERYANLKINEIELVEKEKLVFGIDSSCIKIAEVEDGGLYAVKGSICISFKGKPAAHLKIGPLIFYLNEDALRNLRLEHNVSKLILFNDDYAKKFLRVNIERYIQFWLSKLVSDSIILIDGSLKSSIFENHFYDISKIIENSVINKNSLIGISKNSKIKILKYLSYPLIKSKVSSFVDINLIIRSLISRIHGDHLLVKLSSNQYSNILRADVVSYNNDSSGTLGALLYNELIYFGYPSTLQLSHHVSVFSNTDLASMKSFIKSKVSSFVDINLIIRSLISRIHGDHLLVKLSNNQYSNILRADVVSYNNDISGTLGTLLYNELIYFGYPSTLQLSHHVSVFSNTDLASMKSFIKSNYSVREISHENARSSVLGTAWR